MEPLTVLKRCFGCDTFRGHAQKIIETVLGGPDAFALVPTGGGKSIKGRHLNPKRSQHAPARPSGTRRAARFTIPCHRLIGPAAPAAGDSACL